MSKPGKHPAAGQHGKSKPGKHSATGQYGKSKLVKDSASGQCLAAKDAFIFFFPTMQNYKTMYFQSVQAGEQYTSPFNTFNHFTN